MNTYDIGDTVFVRGEFRDEANLLYNPVGLILKVKAPNGIVTTPSLTNPSTGIFTANIPIPFKKDSQGDWSYRWEVPGPPSQAKEVLFRVRTSKFY